LVSGTWECPTHRDSRAKAAPLVSPRTFSTRSSLALLRSTSWLSRRVSHVEPLLEPWYRATVDSALFRTRIKGRLPESDGAQEVHRTSFALHQWGHHSHVMQGGTGWTLHTASRAPQPHRPGSVRFGGPLEEKRKKKREERRKRKRKKESGGKRGKRGKNVCATGAPPAFLLATPHRQKNEPKKKLRKYFGKKRPFFLNCFSRLFFSPFIFFRASGLDFEDSEAECDSSPCAVTGPEEGGMAHFGPMSDLPQPQQEQF
jgi:hypothetical protein